MKTIIFTVVVLFSSELVRAADVDFINRDFSISNGKIAYRGSENNLGSNAIVENSETYKSKTTDPNSRDFFHVHLKKDKGIPVRSFEFTEGQGGLRSGTIKFNEKGQPLAFTGCDIWSGCITITKRFCGSILGVNGKNAAKVKECTDSLRHILSSQSFKSPTYQDLAASEYKELVDYRKANKLVANHEYKWSTQISKLLATDKGQFVSNSLNQNQSKDLGDHYWGYKDAIQGLGRAYQLCEDHSENLIEGPEERDPTLNTIQFKTPGTTSE